MNTPKRGQTSLQRTLFLAPNNCLCTVVLQFEPPRRGQLVFTKDKVAGLKVSFSQKSHCIANSIHSDVSKLIKTLYTWSILVSTCLCTLGAFRGTWIFTSS